MQSSTNNFKSRDLISAFTFKVNNMMKTIDTKKVKPNTNFIGQNVVYFETTDSTNTVAKQNDYKDGTVVIAESQTAGKGRMGRTWESEQNTGIYMSIVLMPDIPSHRIPMLTLVSGICVCRVLTKMCDVPFKIKWPNDIVAEGKKVCGILTEGVISPNKNKAVVGIGINVANKSFGDELSDKASSIYMLTGKVLERECIINNLLEELEKTYTDFIEGKPFISDYEKLCININRKVTFVKDGEETSGIAVNVAENGELVIKKEDGTTLNINSGEVSVRGIYGYY